MYHYFTHKCYTPKNQQIVAKFSKYFNISREIRMCVCMQFKANDPDRIKVQGHDPDTVSNLVMEESE